MTEAQKCLYYIAENMRIDKSISKEGYEYFQQAIKALEQEPCEDAISRADAIKTAIEAVNDWDGGYNLTRADIIEKAIESLPPVQPKYNTSEWCHDCKEYDQEKHYCPRFNRVIRKTVEEIKQEPILDKIRAEIDSHCSNNRDRNDGLYIAMKIIDKYKAESEE